MREWFVHQPGSDGVIGPLDSTMVAQAILAGQLARESLVARPGDNNWQGVFEVAEVQSELARLDAPPEPAPKPVEAKPDAKKDDKPAAPPDPRLASYPLIIFSACAGLSLILFIIGLVK